MKPPLMPIKLYIEKWKQIMMFVIFSLFLTILLEILENIE